MRRPFAIVLTLFLLILSTCLTAEPAPNEIAPAVSVATTEGLPSNLVNQSVCVISGQYVDHVVDVVLPGPEPLVFSRSYCSLDQAGNLGSGWCSNHGDLLCFAPGVHEKNHVNFFVLVQPSSSRLTYLHPLFGKIKPKSAFSFNLMPPKGLTNGASDEISGRTNLRNQTVTFYPNEEKFIAISGAGNSRQFRKKKYLEDLQAHLYMQSHEYKVNGSCLKYEQGDDLITGIRSITCSNTLTHKTYSSLEFDKPTGKFKDHLTLQLKTSDDKTLTYKFIKHEFKTKVKGKHTEDSNEDYVYYLKQVQKPHQPIESYEYAERETCKLLSVSKKKGADGRFLSIGYYHRHDNPIGGPVGYVRIEDKDDYRLDRVRSLRAPVGTDSKPITTHRFVYAIKVKKNAEGVKETLNGKTDVYDAYWHRTSYRFTDQHRLYEIKKYLGSSHYTPFSKEVFVWGDSGSIHEGNLIGKYLEDGKGKIHHGRFFHYDEKGNVLVKSLWGCLTGLPAPGLALNKHQLPHENGCERENKVYTYSTDGLNLVKSEINSNGTTTLYDYHPGTNLLISKLVVHQDAIQHREYYHYDQNGVLTKKVTDDGKGVHQDDLTGLTERRINYYFPRAKKPVGLSERLDEAYLDLTTGQEVLLKRTGFHYSKEGYLLRQDSYNSQGQYCFSNLWDYDSYGNCIRETNALGETVTKEYDENSNLIFQQGPSLDFAIYNTYDFSNRLIRQEEKHQDGSYFATSHRYNYLNQCIATMDPYGQETVFDYDDLGRLITTHLPSIADETGQLVHPVVRKEYDLAGHPVCLTDAKGRQTKTAYNIRGQPICIDYPDGTQEKFIYQLDGKLLQKTEKNGKRTVYSRDYQGRVLNEMAFGPDGSPLYCQQWTYSAFHPLSFTDKEGLVTRYHYDGAGRLLMAVRGDQIKQHLYDEAGRLAEVREWISHLPHDYRRHLKLYDWLDRVIEERMEDSAGTVFQCYCYTYDARGNKTTVKSGGQVTQTEYNKHSNPVKIINALGQETHVSYDTDFLNELGLTQIIRI